MAEGRLQISEQNFTGASHSCKGYTRKILMMANFKLVHLPAFELDICGVLHNQSIAGVSTLSKKVHTAKPIKGILKTNYQSKESEFINLTE